MKIIKYEEMKERIMGVEDFQEIEIEDNSISVYDSYENRYINFRNLEKLNLEDIFQLNSLKVNKDNFFDTVKVLDKNMFMTVEKIVFINSMEELDALNEEYPWQEFNEDGVIGMNYYNDNVIVINVMLLKKIALEDELDLAGIIYHDINENIHRGIWQTLIHELRHIITYNPIINEDEIPIDEGSEENVEMYCIEIYDKYIAGNQDSYCFN